MRQTAALATFPSSARQETALRKKKLRKTGDVEQLLSATRIKSIARRDPLVAVAGLVKLNGGWQSGTSKTQDRFRNGFMWGYKVIKRDVWRALSKQSYLALSAFSNTKKNE